MTRRTLSVILLLFSPASAGDEAASSRAWGQLFAQPAPGKAAAQMEAVLKACDNDPGRLQALAASDKAYEAFKAGWQRRTLPAPAGDQDHECEFFLRVPADYAAEGSKSWPLLLLAHGQKSNGAEFGKIMEKLLGEAAEGYVIVSPTMPGEAIYNGRAYQEQSWLAPLAWARRALNVDDDRLFVTGYSQGGHHTWHLATMFPHLWAAAVPMAGVPFFEGSPFVTNLYLPNLSNLPLWAIWGEKDRAQPPALGNVDLCRAAAAELQRLGNANFQGTELPGAAHDQCRPRRQELLGFLSRHKRTVAPVSLTHFFHSRRHGRAYYLEALEYGHSPLDLTKPPRVRIESASPPTQEQVEAATQALLERQIFKLSATLEPARNSLTIRADSIRKVRLYLFDGMLDLAKPVTIRFWRHTWKGPIPRSARCLLAHYADDRDATALVANEIDLDIAGKAVLRYDDKAKGR
jgi:pimeloyl-ACP methyl ester carboxylesterase